LCDESSQGKNWTRKEAQNAVQKPKEENIVEDN